MRVAAALFGNYEYFFYSLFDNRVQGRRVDLVLQVLLTVACWIGVYSLFMVPVINLWWTLKKLESLVRLHLDCRDSQSSAVSIPYTLESSAVPVQCQTSSPLLDSLYTPDIYTCLTL